MGSAGPVGRHLGRHHDEAFSIAYDNFYPRASWSAAYPPQKPEPDLHYGVQNPNHVDRAKGSTPIHTEDMDHSMKPLLDVAAGRLHADGHRNAASHGG